MNAKSAGVPLATAASFLLLLPSFALPAGAEKAADPPPAQRSGLQVNDELNPLNDTLGYLFNQDGSLDRSFTFALGLSESAEFRVNAGISEIRQRSLRHELALARISENAGRGERIDFPADPAMYVELTAGIEALLKEAMNRPDTAAIASMLAAASPLRQLLWFTSLREEKNPDGTVKVIVETYHDPKGANPSSRSADYGEGAVRRWGHLLSAKSQIRTKTSPISPRALAPDSNPYAVIKVPHDLLWTTLVWPRGIKAVVAPLEMVLQRMEVLDELQRMEALHDKVQDGLTFARRFRTEIEDCRKEVERGLERQLARAGQGSITLDFAKGWEDVHRCRNGILNGLPEGGDRIWLQNCFAGMREYQTLEFSAVEAPDHSGRRIVAVRDPASGKQVGWLWGEGTGTLPLEKRIFERMGLPVTPPPPPGLEADPFAAGGVQGDSPSDDPFAPVKPK